MMAGIVRRFIDQFAEKMVELEDEWKRAAAEGNGLRQTSVEIVMQELDDSLSAVRRGLGRAVDAGYKICTPDFTDELVENFANEDGDCGC
jgi:hypothetical protein